MLAQDVVQRQLVVLLARFEVAQHQQARHPELAAGEGLHAARADADGPLRSDAARQLLALGATVLREPGDQRWWVLADPEGNEFCAFPPEAVATNDEDAEVAP